MSRIDDMSRREAVSNIAFVYGQLEQNVRESVMETGTVSKNQSIDIREKCCRIQSLCDRVIQIDNEDRGDEEET